MKWYSTLLALLVSISVFSNVRLPAVLGNNMVLQQQSQVKIWGWADPYEKVVVTTSWDGKSWSCIGSNNAQWQVMVQTPAAGGPFTITIRGKNNIELNNILVGEVWICSGQSNMEMSGQAVLKGELSHALNNNIRFFHIPKTTALTPQNDCSANWTICDSNTLKTFSAVGYFFGKDLQKELQVPIGLIAASWGGTSAEVWTPDSIVNADPVLKTAATYIAPSGMCPNLPGYAYNGMIAPVINFNIAGAIWYQGENNTCTPYTYPQLFTSMIDGWRRAWQKEFPFYYVQIAPFNYKAANTGALLREAQLKSMQHPKTGMVVITDLVDNIYDVHPANKHDVGLRLSKWALAETYHKQVIAYKSPLVTRLQVQKNKAILSFDQELMIKGKVIRELRMGGDDRIFYPATAYIKGNTLVATSKQVAKPVAIRFGFSDTARGNLFSTEGLPVSPFRTDNWEVEADVPLPAKGISIEWDSSTLRKVSATGKRHSGYARLIVLPDSSWLATYEAEGSVVVSKSTDKGSHWSEPVVVAARGNGYNMSVPDLLLLKDGSILICYNPRPFQISPERKFAIRTKKSYDGGATWKDERLLYEAGHEFKNGCWEPCAIQLPNGEIQLFFANEGPYTKSEEQDISLLRSTDNGLSWTPQPTLVSFRAGSRDGMPVPVLLNNGKEIVLVIEDNGFSNFKPYIIRNTLKENWSKPVLANDKNRSYALLEKIADSIYAGAPYLRQLPSGETILSYQGTEGRPNSMRHAEMKVAIGSAKAGNFRSVTPPFNIPPSKSGLWNSLSVVDNNTVVALTSTNAYSDNGATEVWMIIGHVKR